MIAVKWHPSSEEMRQWALITAPALGVVGSLFYFLDWGIFAGGRNFAKFLWLFGVVAFFTGLTGTRIGLPAYWAWMAFVCVVSSIISLVSLTLVYFGVVMPLAVFARVCGRDRLKLLPAQSDTYWLSIQHTESHDSERQF